MHFMEALSIAIERGWKTINEVLHNIKSDCAFRDDSSGIKLKQLYSEWNTVKLNSNFTAESSVVEVMMWLKYTDDGLKDELGGIHEEGLGWSPNGDFCGECSNMTCVGCPQCAKVRQEL